MSCIEYETVEIGESTIEKEDETQSTKLLAVPTRLVHPSDQVAARAAEVLNAQLERGSMPT